MTRTRYIGIAVFTYVVAASAWIFLSDRLLESFDSLPSAIYLSTIKGLGFVAVTAGGFLITLRGVPPREAPPRGQVHWALDTDDLPGATWPAYLLASGATLALVLFRFALPAAHDTHPMVVLFMLPIILSAMLGGWGPGVLATLLAMAGVLLFNLSTVPSWSALPTIHVVQWLFLGGCGLIVSATSGRLRRSLADARRSRRQLEAIVQGTTDAVFIKDQQGRYQMVNAAAARYLGHPAEAILGASDRELLPADTAGMIEAQDRKVMEGRQTRSEFEHFVGHDGQVLDFLATKGPVFDAGNEVVGLFGIARDVTELRRIESELQASHERLKLFIDHSPAALAMFDRDMRYLVVSRRWVEDFQLQGQELIGRSHYEVLPEIDEHLRAIHRRSLDGEVLQGDAERFVRANGTVQWVRWECRPWRDLNGQIGGIVIFTEMVTDIVAAQDQMRISAGVFDSAGEAIMIADPRGVIESVNAAFSEITGYTAQEAIGQPASLLKSGQHDDGFYRAMWNEIAAQGAWQGEILNRRKNGEIYPEWLTITTINDRRGQLAHYLAVFSDISKIKEGQRQVEFLATHDTLTRLPNRALFLDRLEHGLAQAQRSRTRLAVLFIDLDNFKTINDTLGHDVGDALLVQVAPRLSGLVREGDTVARLGGDEFTVLLDGFEGSPVNEVTARIVAQLAEPYRIDGRTLYLTASIGVALYPEDGTTAAELIKAADSAMYRAKELGRNRTEFFRPELGAQLLRRSRIEAGLREALAGNGLRVVFQPKISAIGAPAMVGAEVLVRWRDAGLGDVSPAEFIPVAEASGLIDEVSTRVRQLVLAQAQDWRARGLAVPTLAVNVSPRSLRDTGFAERVLDELSAHGLTPSALQIEITEGALLDSGPVVEANLDTLNAAGVGISLDDFGTGYSSLSYLKRLNLRELKIDKSFVDGLGTDRDDEAITSSILALAASLGLTTVAEGVETDLQLDWLRAHGCQMVQGYRFHPPLERAVFETLLDQPSTA